MAQALLDRRRELAHRLPEAWDEEDGIVAEPSRPVRYQRNASAPRSASDGDHPQRLRKDQRASVPRAAFPRRHSGEQAQEFGIVGLIVAMPSGKTRRANARRPTQRFHFDPRIIRESQVAGRARHGPRLLERVGVKRPPGFRQRRRIGKLGHRAPTNPGNVQQRFQLPEFMTVARGNDDGQHAFTEWWAERLRADGWTTRRGRGAATQGGAGCPGRQGARGA